MYMDIPFFESRARPAVDRKNVLSTLILQVSGWISARRAVRRSTAELRGMDDRMLRDIGLRREEIESFWQYGRLPGGADDRL
jgi:uncharacterized protein YjiS (DUF1127 family)